ncbi:MAG: gliding motility-associated C-terminal domain-containing protein, partial [Bacteroidota bacterium]
AEGLKHIIRWNPYSTWNGTVDHYLVYRVDQDNTVELISTELDTSCSIDISGYLEQKVSGEFCYYVEAYEKDNPYNVNGVSRSNLACIAEEPLVFFPNAFTPDHDGLNDEFRPVVSFSSTIDYEFRVYNRWGEIIFRAYDPTEGWNGKIHGRNAKEGVYIYYVCFTSALNKVFEQSGFFSLIYQ